jgi:hypothetical protein
MSPVRTGCLQKSSSSSRGDCNSSGRVYCRNGSTGGAVSVTGSTSFPVPGRAARVGMQLADSPSSEARATSSRDCLHCYAGRPSWQTCLRPFLGSGQAKPLLQGQTDRRAAAELQESNLPTRQLGVTHHHLRPRPGSAAAWPAPEQQPGTPKAYQVYICGPGSMAAAVKKAVDELRDSSGGLMAPVLLHNINQSL